MDRNETYSYFKHDKIDAWDYLGYNALRMVNKYEKYRTKISQNIIYYANNTI